MTEASVLYDIIGNDLWWRNHIAILQTEQFSTEAEGDLQQSIPEAERNLSRCASPDKKTAHLNFGTRLKECVFFNC